MCKLFNGSSLNVLFFGKQQCIFVLNISGRSGREKRGGSYVYLSVMNTGQ